MSEHDGHREVLRQNFLATGFKGKTDHQILEMVLMYAIPRKDVNPLAHRLVSAFGNLANVCDASYEELAAFPGVTENAAVLLKMIPALVNAYSQSKFKEKVRCDNLKDLIDYLRGEFLPVAEEAIFLVCMDNHFHLRSCDYISTESTFVSSAVDPKALVTLVLRRNAAQVIIVHNHPSGSFTPSYKDCVATKQVMAALELINVPVMDHLILGSTGTYSFAVNGLIEKLENMILVSCTEGLRLRKPNEWNNDPMEDMRIQKYLSAGSNLYIEKFLEE